MSGPLVVGNQDLGADLRALIEELGYRLVIHKPYAVASGAYATLAPDVVMAELIGSHVQQTCRWAEALRARFAVPLLCIAHPECRLSLESAKRVGPDGYLVRPLHAAQLQASLELALREPPEDTPSGVSEARERYAGESAPASGGPEGVDLSQLSSREQEVFQHLVEGRRVAEVSDLLFISPHTVRQHAKAIFRKLGMHSQIELMRRYGGKVRTRR